MPDNTANILYQGAQMLNAAFARKRQAALQEEELRQRENTIKQNYALKQEQIKLQEDSLTLQAENAKVSQSQRAAQIKISEGMLKVSEDKLTQQKLTDEQKMKLDEEKHAASVAAMEARKSYNNAIAGKLRAEFGPEALESRRLGGILDRKEQSLKIEAMERSAQGQKIESLLAARPQQPNESDASYVYAGSFKTRSEINREISKLEGEIGDQTQSAWPGMPESSKQFLKSLMEKRNALEGELLIRMKIQRELTASQAAEGNIENVEILQGYEMGGERQLARAAGFVGPVQDANPKQATHDWVSGMNQASAPITSAGVGAFLSQFGTPEAQLEAGRSLVNQLTKGGMSFDEAIKLIEERS